MQLQTKPNIDFNGSDCKCNDEEIGPKNKENQSYLLQAMKKIIRLNHFQLEQKNKQLPDLRS